MSKGQISIKSTDEKPNFPTENNSVKIFTTFPLESDISSEKKSFLKKVKEIPCSGIFLAALSSVFFSTGNLCCRLLNDEINANQVVVIRSVFLVIVYSTIICWKNQSVFGFKGERFSLFLRGGFGFLSLAGNYIAIQKLGLSDASAIVFSAPVFTTFLAFLLIGEPLSWGKIVTLFMVIFGIILICKPEIILVDHKVEIIEDEGRFVGSIVAFSAALGNAMVYIILRKLKKTPASVSILSLSFISILFGCILNVTLFSFDLPQSTTSWIIIIINSLCGIFGQLLLTIALKIEEAGAVSLARTMDIVMSFIYQITILNQNIEVHTLIGALIICVGVGLTSASKIIESYKQKSSNKTDK